MKIHNGDITEPGTYDYEIVMGNIDAWRDGTISLPNCTTVGGYVSTRDGKVTLPKCTTVGGYVYAWDGGTINLPKCTTVGRFIHTWGKGAIKTPKLKRKEAPEAAHRIIFNRLKKQGFLWADRILHVLVSERKTKTGTVYKTRLIGGDEVNYVVESGGVYAHGKTVREARDALAYKLSDRDTSMYEDWTVDKVVTRKQAIQSYMAITGACATGTKQFVDGLASVKSKYKISEVIELTKGQFGNEQYAEFFKEAK